MKVLLLSHEYPPYAFGGVAYYTKELAKYLASQGFTVYVITGHSSKPYIEFESNIRIIRMNFPNFPIRSFWYSITSRGVALKLAKVADHIMFNAGSSGLLPIWLRKPAKDKRIISVFHGTIHSLISYLSYVKFKDKLKFADFFDVLYYTSFLPIANILNRQELKVSDYIVTVAQHIIEELVQIHPEISERLRFKSITVYGGLDCDYFSRIYKFYKGSTSNKQEKVIYAYIGRLFLSKGVHYAVESFKFIQEELNGKTELWVFGNGPLKKRLEIHAKRNDLNVKFFGFMPREKLMELLVKHVSVLLFPSLYEGCPYTLLEANALGVPVVAWDMPWSREFIFQGVNGYLAKSFSLEELAERAMKALSLHPERTRETALKYNKENTFSKLKHLLVGNLH